MIKYQDWKDEHTTLQLISQILGKIKLETAFQEPQCAHIMLDITPQGFSTGFLTYQDTPFSLEVNLVTHEIKIIIASKEFSVTLENNKSVKTYYEEIFEILHANNINVTIHPTPQEMTTKIPLDEDETHHHYDPSKMATVLKMIHLAHHAESRFINPLRARKVKSGLFWGTFDVTAILIYNQVESFPDDTKVIERAAFDEHMIEFGFWFGDEKFENPTFFILPYPFSNRKFVCGDEFPRGSYYDENMMEFILTYDQFEKAEDKEAIIKHFFEAGFHAFKDYLEWKNCEHYSIPLKMRENHKQ